MWRNMDLTQHIIAKALTVHALQMIAYELAVAKVIFPRAI